MEGIELLMQIPLAGIIVLVVIYFLNYLKSSEERNQQFIREQREQNNLATARLAEEIKCISKEVVMMRESSVTFQARMDAAVSEMRNITRKHAPKSSEAD